MPDVSTPDGNQPIEPGTFGFGLVAGATSRRRLLAGGGMAAVAALLGTAGPASALTRPRTTPDSTTPATEPDSSGATETMETAAPEAQTETLTIGLQTLQEQYVDPHFAVGGLVFPLTWAIADYLYRLDENAQYVPGLATDYEVSDDQLTWTFTLRDDVLMQDGSQFTAADVKTAVDRIVQGADFTHLATFKSYVTGATVIDDTHVQVETSAPYGTLVSDMPPPIPTGYYNEVGDAAFREQPMAAGAWKFVSQSLNTDVRYERFDDFWDASRKPNFRQLVFQIVPDESSRVAGLQTGELDIAFGLSASAASQFDGESDYTLVETPESALAYCFALDNVFPDEDGPLKDLDVRRALLMAIDREGIAASLYGGFAEAPASPVPSVMLGYDPDVEAVPYDPEGAQALLEEAGHGGMTVTLNSYNATSSIPDIEKLAETIATLWRQVGVETELNLADAGTILPAWRSRQLHGAGLLAGPVYFYQEPARLTSSFFSTDASYSTVSDPDLDALAAEINETTDVAGREELGRQLSDLLNEQLWGLPVLTVSSLSVTGPNVASWTTITGCPYVSVAWLRAV